MDRTSRLRQLAAIGQTPVVTGRRFSFNVISAVSPRGDFRSMIHEGTAVAKTFKEFLTRLMIGATQPVFVIVDGHPIHKSKLVRDYVATQEAVSSFSSSRPIRLT